MNMHDRNVMLVTLKSLYPNGFKKYSIYNYMQYEVFLYVIKFEDGCFLGCIVV